MEGAKAFISYALGMFQTATIKYWYVKAYAVCQLGTLLLV